jgi:hypothetical protein
MITITITDERQLKGIAAQTIEYNEANGQTLTDEQYAQFMTETTCNSLADKFNVGIITSSEYVLRFTPQENQAITDAAATDPLIAQYLTDVRSASRVVLYSDEVVQGHQYLVASALLTQQRSDEILAY